MDREKTLEELKQENEQLRALLRQVYAAHQALGEVLDACPIPLEEQPNHATVDSTSEVKRLLEKYSRL